MSQTTQPNCVHKPIPTRFRRHHTYYDHENKVIESKVTFKVFVNHHVRQSIYTCINIYAVQ